MYDRTAFLGTQFLAMVARPSGRGRISTMGWIGPSQLVYSAENVHDQTRYLAKVNCDESWLGLDLAWFFDHEEYFSSWAYVGLHEKCCAIAVLQLDGRTVLRSTADGSLLEESILPGPSEKLFKHSILGTSIGFCPYPGRIYYSNSGGLEIYAIESGQCIYRVEAAEGKSLRSVALSPGGVLAHVVDDQPIVLFDIIKGIQWEIPRELTPWPTPNGTGGTANGLAFYEGRLLVWADWNFNVPVVYVVDIVTGGVETIRTDFDRNYLALTVGESHDWAIWGWIEKEGEGVNDLRLYRGMEAVGRACSLRADRLALSPRGKYLALFRDNLLYVGLVKEIFQPLVRQ